MRKLSFTAGMILGLVSGAAMAADMPLKAVAPPPPVLSWAGFYIGGHGGYGWKDDPFSAVVFTNPLTTIGGFQSQGWVAGGQVGYNWQVGGFVGGLEVDLSAADIKGNSALVSFDEGDGRIASESFGDKVKLLGSARGRFGWAVSPDWLLYGTGGLAWEHLDQTSFFSVVVPNQGTVVQNITTPTNQFGWVLGAGVEYRLWQSNWIGRLEYLHYDFGHTRTSSSIVTTLPGQVSSSNPVGDQTIDVVRVGLSYKFGG